MELLLREQITHEEFDYQVLKSALESYASPRDKITNLMRKGVIVRVKKGVYVFGKAYRRREICKELLANLIFGPSMVSLEYALGYYGLIPERVEVITSVTTGRARFFDTPLGRFSYRATRSLSIGVDRIETASGSFLMATRERALADTVAHLRGMPITSLQQMNTYLQVDLRVAPGDLAQLDAAQLHEYAALQKSNKVALCARVVELAQGRKNEQSSI